MPQATTRRPHSELLSGSVLEAESSDSDEELTPAIPAERDFGRPVGRLRQSRWMHGGIRNGLGEPISLDNANLIRLEENEPRETSIGSYTSRDKIFVRELLELSSARPSGALNEISGWEYDCDTRERTLLFRSERKPARGSADGDEVSFQLVPAGEQLRTPLPKVLWNVVCQGNRGVRPPEHFN